MIMIITVIMTMIKLRIMIIIIITIKIMISMFNQMVTSEKRLGKLLGFGLPINIMGDELR